MGKLKAMPPRLAAMPARLGPSLPTEQARDRYRASTQHWRAWYKSPRWRALRASVLLRDRFTCAMCGRIEGDTSKMVCDHIKPHRGDDALFWSESNLQTLCASPCHNAHKQARDIADALSNGKPIASLWPEWVKPSVVPVTVVCGPPASGKSTYVAKHASRGALVIDMDEIGKRLFDLNFSYLSDDQRQIVLHERNNMIGSLSRRPSCSEAWLIVESRGPNGGSFGSITCDRARSWSLRRPKPSACAGRRQTPQRTGRL